MLRGSVGRNPKSYYEYEGEPYYYEHSRKHKGLFRIRKDETVEIRSVKKRGDILHVNVRSSRLGSGRVAFSSPLHSPVIDEESFRAGFEICFRAEGAPEIPPALVLNTSSQKYHVSDANHLPPIEMRESYASVEEAEAAGMTKCNLCFIQRPLVSGYYTERMMGLQGSQDIRAFGQLSVDDQLQHRADRIGKKVLSNWPVPLQGYAYRFFVMEDDEVNAYALPTGFVYVNRGLLESTESELEIESVLAHEIAHVERRHSYRIYRRAKRNELISAGAGLLAAAITGAATKDKKNKGANATLAGALALTFADAVTKSLFEGFPRSMEEEADAVAALYLERSYGEEGLLAMSTVLRKLRYYTDYSSRSGAQKALQAFRSHPLLDDRIATFQGSSVVFFTKPIRLVGLKDGEEAVEIVLTSQRVTSAAVAGRYSLDRTQALGSVYGTAEIGKPRKLKEIELVTSDGRRIKLDNKEDSLFGPYEEEGFLLRGKEVESLETLTIVSAKVNLGKLKLTWDVR